MQQQFSISQKISLALIAAIEWFALTAQFYLILQNKVVTSIETIIRFFSFFTISTNLLVAVCCTTLLLAPSSKWGHFFSRYTTLTSIAVYIAIVGLIYNTILRFLWDSTGLQAIVHELLHGVTPVFFLIYWFAFVKKYTLKWTALMPWMIYPLAYLVYVLLLGQYTGFYVYPFIDVSKIGMQQTLINSLGITFVFITFSFLFIGIGNAVSSNKKNRS